ncbi:hypothetical protein ACXN5S_12845 [Pseudoroseicyclus sp. H15]
MAIRVEHELHKRRSGRNYGLLIILIAFVALVFGLTVVKVSRLGDIRTFESFDHVANPALIPQDEAEETGQ